MTVAWAVRASCCCGSPRGAPGTGGGLGWARGAAAGRVRAVALDAYWSADTTPVWNLAFLVHLLVVVALAIGGGLAGRAGDGTRLGGRPPASARRSGWRRWVRWRSSSGASRPDPWPAMPADRRARRRQPPGAKYLRRPPSSSPPPCWPAWSSPACWGRTTTSARGAAGSLVSLVFLIRVAACAGRNTRLTREPLFPGQVIIRPQHAGRDRDRPAGGWRRRRRATKILAPERSRRHS